MNSQHHDAVRKESDKTNNEYYHKKRISEVFSVKNRKSKMSVEQYRRYICECIYEINEKGGLDRIYNVVMQLTHEQPEKSEFSVKEVLYSLIDDIEDDERLEYVVYFLRGLNGNNKRSVGGV